MAPAQDATMQGRRLRASLRRARAEAGLTLPQVADALRWSLSKVIRIEQGGVGISATDLWALLQLYGISDEDEVARLTEMARASKEQPAWWNKYRGISSRQFLSFLSYESSASVINQFHPRTIPGLLQTEDYVRAVIGGLEEEGIKERVDLRMRRQQEVFERDNPPEMQFVLDESVLHRWVGGPAVMRRQLERLRTLAAEERVTIDVVPYSTGIYHGMQGPFVLLEFPNFEDEDLLFIEDPRGNVLNRENQDEVREYREVFARLRALAGKTNLDTMLDKAAAELPE